MTTAEAYREGLARGRELAAHANTQTEHDLRRAVERTWYVTDQARRARAVGELRGYRNATDDWLVRR